jgi:hypothetical protein
VPYVIPPVDVARTKLAPRAKPVKQHIIRPAAAEAGTIREEPEWEGVSLVPGSPEERMALHAALNWYNYVMDEKHYRKCVEEWLRATQKEPDKFIKMFHRVPDKSINATMVAVMRLHVRGYPVSQLHYKSIQQWLVDTLKTYARKKGEKDSAQDTPDRPNIQDRIRNQVRPVLAEVDALTDSLLDQDPDFAIDDVKKLLHNPEFKAPQYRIIADHIERYLREWNKVMLAKTNVRKADSEDDEEQAYNEDLRTAYAYLSLRELKAAIKVLSDVNSEIRGTMEAVKTPRKKKARSPEKMVAKVRYKPECEDLGVTSLHPKAMLGATTVYLFNCSRRKLIKLTGEFAGSIDVNRSTLVGVNLAASATKTLRKPEEQLKEFLALRKTAVDKWFDRIKSKPRPARTRLNVETIILRAD